MTMAMQIDGGALPHIPPCSERVVAEHKPDTIDHQFRIKLKAPPAVAAGDNGIIVVAGDEVAYWLP